jgi:hypothetical protein
MCSTLFGEQRVTDPPQQRPAEYARASSSTRAAGLLQDALLLVHGVRDVVVLYRDSAWLLQYLMSPRAGFESAPAREDVVATARVSPAPPQ